MHSILSLVSSEVRVPHLYVLLATLIPLPRSVSFDDLTLPSVTIDERPLKCGIKATDDRTHY